VAGRDDTEAINAFVNDLSVDGFEHIIDLDGVVWGQYDIFSQPAFAFINDDGTVETVMGAMGEDGLIEAAERLRST